MAFAAALDEFGLRASLMALAAGFGERTGLRVRHHIDPALPALDAETELALYRMAQGAITNVRSPRRAREVELLLRSDGARGRAHGGRRRAGDVRRGPAQLARCGRDARNAPCTSEDLAVRASGAAGDRGAADGADPDGGRGTRSLLGRDDRTLVRSGLRMILDAGPRSGGHRGGRKNFGVEAVERGLREDVDLAVLDVTMYQAGRPARRARARATAARHTSARCCRCTTRSCTACRP